ncbi:MAG: hypothetical protein M0P77_04245 [Firmicutes bacterium]|nr:hypothetical protein [Bacillota bacterium]
MILISCTENCIHQKDGMCSLEQIGKASNTTTKGCEFYVEKSRKPSKKSDST